MNITGKTLMINVEHNLTIGMIIELKSMFK
jgi:hypothetical protein